jgi:hypothetical protein
MSPNRNSHPVPARQKQDPEASRAVRSARADEKPPKSKPTVEGVSRREGAPEPASKH